MPLPIPFVLHTWIVVTHNDISDRYDVMGFHEDGAGKRNGYLYTNFHSPETGVPILAIGTKRLLKDTLQWESKVLFTLQGDVGSPAHKIWELLHNQQDTYPYIHQFGLVFGPNCNTFTQWVLDQGTSGEITLPWGAWGKGYRVKQ
jgi:hypothetical protein